MPRRPRRLRSVEDQKQQCLVIYSNKKDCLNKKAHQLSSLCAVPVAVISFTPDGRLHTWPDDREALRDFLVTYRSLDPAKRQKHDLDLPALLGAPPTGQNLLWDPRLDAMPSESLRDLANSLESKVEALDERIQQLLHENSNCGSQDDNHTTRREQGDDSKCRDNNTGRERGDDSRCDDRVNNTTRREQCLPPCSRPVVFDPFPINKRNAVTDCHNVPKHELYHGRDPSGIFFYPPYISIAFDPYLVNYPASMGVFADACLPGSSSSSSAATNFGRAINSSSQAFSSEPPSPLMPTPSTSTATTVNSRAEDGDQHFCPPRNLYESIEFLMGGGDI